MLFPPGSSTAGAATALPALPTPPSGRGAISLFLATMLGVPVSTTHVITGGIVGVGAVTRAGAVRWRVAVRVVWAWLFTVQCAAAIAALTMLAEGLVGFR